MCTSKRSFSQGSRKCSVPLIQVVKSGDAGTSKSAHYSQLTGREDGRHESRSPRHQNLLWPPVMQAPLPGLLASFATGRPGDYRQYFLFLPVSPPKMITFPPISRGPRRREVVHGHSTRVEVSRGWWELGVDSELQEASRARPSWSSSSSSSS